MLFVIILGGFVCKHTRIYRWNFVLLLYAYDPNECTHYVESCVS